MPARWFGACVLLFCAAAWGQSGTTPKGAAGDYPVQGKAGELALGAEYLVHSVSSGQQTFVAPDYLVVQVAVYPPKGQPVEISAGQFRLRINGKKGTLYPQAPGFVAASLKYPDWEYRPTLEAGAGIGGGGVTIGRPNPVERFPGDRRPTEGSAPPPPQVPAQVPGGVEKQPAQTAAEAVVDAALPEGRATGPVSGHLYFPYKGKLKSIKSLELIFEQGERQTVLKLR